MRHRAVSAVVAAGVVCRLVQYLWDRSYWVDEASLVLNIRGKSAGELLGKLDYHQAAPPLFLLVERALYHFFGGSEWSLRLLPLVAGCAAVVLFAGLARQILTPRAAIVAVALFAFADRLIWHTVEVKQYGIDVFVAVLLTWLAARFMIAPARLAHRSDSESDPLSVRSPFTAAPLIPIAVAAAIAVWFSFPAAFVFGGISLAVLATARAGVRRLAIYVLCNLLVVASIAGVMLLSGRARHDQALVDYWADDFIHPRHPLAVPLWLARHLFALCDYSTAGGGVLVFPCAVAGIIWLARAGRLRELAILLNPIGIHLVAAAAGLYPFDGARLTAYLTPGVLLLAGAGAEAIYLWLRTRAGKAALAPAAVMVTISAANAAFHLAVPRWRDHIRPAVAFVRRNIQPGDGIYALQRREFDCYWPAGDPRVRSNLDRADRLPFKRFWIVWAFPNQPALRRMDRVKSWAGAFATQKAAFVGAGGCAYLYEVTGPRNNKEPPSLLTHHRVMSTDEAGVGAGSDPASAQ